MSYRMLVTTFKDDIKQFHMFCHTLVKNWQGEKDLMVCIGNSEDPAMYRAITDQAFPPGWTIQIKESVHAYVDGYVEQQVNAVYYSVTSGVENVIVWDCKDFILKPCDLTEFINMRGEHRITYVFPNSKITDADIDNKTTPRYNFSPIDLLDEPIDDVPLINNIRPWIWNVPVLSRYWNHINARFGNHTTWERYPAGCEIYGYFTYAMKDPARTFEFNRQLNKIVFSGAYSYVTYENLVKDVEDFNSNTWCFVWKHSRRNEDPRYLEITKSVLKRYGIKQDVIDQVYGS